ncbi:MAG: Rid family hydrolase [Phycisphaerae bacterium]|nr:Rid family hydrolase [Phycisphaerae bacterium]
MISIHRNNHGVEAFVTMCAKPGVSFTEALDDLVARYDAAISQEGLGRDSAALLRFHVSDAHTQATDLLQRLKDFSDDALVSIVQQPPASGGKVALEAYHISTDGAAITKQSDSTGLLIGHGPYHSLWGQLLPQPSDNCSPYNQTEGILNTLSEAMAKHGGTVKDNVIRTWFYVRDIDNNYAGMVDARREWFAEVGMTTDTHYITSTGIEGNVAKPSDLVMLNYLAVLGLDKQQIHFMSALDNLCPTHKYGVTFERGTRITFGDRSHYYISGTASIDNKGDVLHIGDVIKQTERTLENISALMTESGGALEDMKLIIVYLRDRADYQQVDEYLAEHMPKSTAYIIVEGAVCRPTWLIEMDGVAITDHCDEKFAPFC